MKLIFELFLFRTLIKMHAFPLEKAALCERFKSLPFTQSGYAKATIAEYYCLDRASDCRKFQILCRFLKQANYLKKKMTLRILNSLFYFNEIYT